MEDTTDNAIRMSAELMSDLRGRARTHFVHRLCDEMLNGVRVYPRKQTDVIPDSDVVMTSDGVEKMRAMFEREPDMLASFLPDGFVVVDKATLEKVMEPLAGAVPLAALVGGRSLGPISGKVYVEMVLRMSADRLSGMSEMARREHEDEQQGAAPETKTPAG